jgi:Fe-S cluster biosynthesis and repair protein YggX
MTTNTQPPRKIYCSKLKQELEGLGFAPHPGELGKRIYNEISKQAWQDWLKHQTMLINENKLNVLDKETRKYLESEMINYLFGEGSALPEGYTPPKQ